MGDKDSKLIFENYIKSKNDIFEEADDSNKSGVEKAWEWVKFVGKVLDPTGITSYPDVISSVKKYSEDQSVENLTFLVLNVFTALPNLGLLAAGVGGVGWAALKAAAKTAIKTGGKEAAPIATKILQLIKNSKELQYAFDKILDSLTKNEVITKTGSDIIKIAIREGGVSRVSLGKGVEEVLGDTTAKQFKSAAEEYLKKDTGLLGKIGVRGKAEIPQLGTRAAKEIIGNEDLEYKDVLPKHLFSAKEYSISKDNKGQPIKGPDGKTYPVGKIIYYKGDDKYPAGRYKIVL